MNNFGATMAPGITPGMQYGRQPVQEQLQQQAQATGMKKCAHCGSDLPAAARFCFICGEKQPFTCPHRGADPPAGAQFCFMCGTTMQ